MTAGLTRKRALLEKLDVWASSGCLMLMKGLVSATWVLHEELGVFQCSPKHVLLVCLACEQGELRTPGTGCHAVVSAKLCSDAASLMCYWCHRCVLRVGHPHWALQGC